MDQTRFTKVVWRESPDEDARVARGRLMKIEDGMIFWRLPDGESLVIGQAALVALKE
jgi:hypothetical protein